MQVVEVFVPKILTCYLLYSSIPQLKQRKNTFIIQIRFLEDCLRELSMQSLFLAFDSYK